jgi:general secretion pathway protein C
MSGRMKEEKMRTMSHELLNGEKLSEIINTCREFFLTFAHSNNLKYIVLGVSIVISSICLGRTITAWLSFNLIPEPGLTLPAPQKSKFLATLRPRTNPQALDFKSIIDRNLFEEEQKPEDLPLATLRLKLVGTIVDKDGDISTAIIEDLAKREQSLYHVGERIKNALIKKILRTYVIVNTGKRDEILSMRPEELKNKQKDSSRTTKGKIKIPRKVIETSMSNLANIMQDALIKPYLIRGQIAGFKITKIKPDSIYTKLGLQNGDVLLDINKEKLDSPRKLLNLYERFKDKSKIKLKISRAGKEETVEYQIY